MFVAAGVWVRAGPGTIRRVPLREGLDGPCGLRRARARALAPSSLFSTCAAPPPPADIILTSRARACVRARGALDLTVLVGDAPVPAGYTRLDKDLTKGAGPTPMFLAYRAAPKGEATDAAIGAARALWPWRGCEGRVTQHGVGSALF